MLNRFYKSISFSKNNNSTSKIMKKFSYTFAIIILIVSSSFLTSCTADEITDSSNNQSTVNSTVAVDPPVLSDRPK